MDDTEFMKKTALSYAERGWHVFPLRNYGDRTKFGKLPLPNCARCRPVGEGILRRKPHRPEDCPCIPQGKFCHGAYAATTKPALIEKWWVSSFGIAVSCGPSGLIVLDCDDHGGEPPEEPVESRPGICPLTPRTGMEVMLMAAVANKDANVFSSTAVTVTPGGGRQLLFTASDAMDFKPNSKGAFGWQIDVRAGITQTTLAPTRRPDGVYRWDRSDEPAPLPSWIRSMLVDSGLHRPTEAAKAARIRKAAPVRTEGPSRALVQRIFSRELAELRNCTGGVNEQLNRASFVLGKLVGQDAATYDDTLTKLFEAARYAVARKGIPFDADKTRATIEDGLTGGIEKIEAEMDET